MFNFREKLIRLLRKTQLRLDTTNYFLDKPKFDYQPIPWVGIETAGIRGKATIGRWRVIKQNLLKKDVSMKDIGCCVGFFCISASKERGMLSVGIDANNQFLRIANNSMPENLLGKCNFINLLVDEKTVGVLPRTEVTLCLSIWHHWIYHYGLMGATKILKTLWETTGRVMFFESGEEEVKDEFNLPFSEGMAATDWLLDYLKNNLSGAKVTKLGSFFAGKYPHYLIKNKKRTLFKIVKKGK